MIWQCAQCGYQIRTPRALTAPVYCRCGAIDAEPQMVIDVAQPPPVVPLPQRVRNVRSAFRRWTLAGRPVRTDDMASELFREHCSRPCPWFVDGTCRHPQCGCRLVDPLVPAPTVSEQLVQLVTAGLWNKLKWGTETCPAGYWT